MRNFFDMFFHEQDEEKITEKKMTTRAISTVAVMITCLIAMSVTAYAYFSCSVTSSFATIRSASFYTKISVQEMSNVATVAVEENVEEVGSLETPPVITSDNKAHKVENLKAGKTYLVTIQPTDNNTAEHGFVIFAAYHTDENGNTSLASSVYHTQQLGVDVAVENGRTNIVSFYLELDADADIILYSHWGTSSYYGYKNEVQETSPIDGEEVKVKDLYVEQGEKVTVAVTGAVLEELEPTPTPIPELTPTPSPMPEITPTPGPEATLTPEPVASSTPGPETPETPAPSSEPVATTEPTVTSAPESTETPVSAPEVSAELPATSAPETATGEQTQAPVAPTEVTPATEMTSSEAAVSEPIE